MHFSALSVGQIGVLPGLWNIHSKHINCHASIHKFMFGFMYIYKTAEREIPYQSIPSQKQTSLIFRNCAGDKCTIVFDDDDCRWQVWEKILKY